MHTPAPVHETIDQTCRRYSVGRTYLYDRIADGQIDAVKVGRRIKIIVASADDFFGAQPKAQIKVYRRRKAA
jgi:excisionase family DNA binding protein